MDEPWLLLGAEAESLGQAIDMALLAAAALHGEAWRLVQGDDVVVAPDDRRAHHLGIGVRNFRPRVRRGRVGQRRHPHPLTGIEARGRLDAPSVDSHLSLAAKLFDATLRHMREMPAEPAIQALTALVCADGKGLDPAHTNVRASESPANRPSNDKPTESIT